MSRFLFVLLFLLLALPTQAFAEDCVKHTDCDQTKAPECHLFLCMNGKCQSQPRPISGPLCDDGDPCTGGDRCKAGKCAGGLAIQSPQCIDPELTGVLCELSGDAGTVQECVVKIQGDVPTAVQVSLQMSDPRAVMHGFFVKRCEPTLGSGCTVAPVRTKVTGMSLDTTTTDQGHMLFVVPFNMSNWTGTGAVVAVNMVSSTPVVRQEGEDLFRIQVGLAVDVAASDPVKVVAGSVTGSDGLSTSVSGKATKEALVFTSH